VPPDILESSAKPGSPGDIGVICPIEGAFGTSKMSFLGSPGRQFFEREFDGK
jgi:hypothetical protein